MLSPKHIRSLTEAGILELVWDDERTDRIPFWQIRTHCRCAVCVDENTGRQLLNPETVPKSIRPDSAELTGNYAIKFRWTDGHDSGLFTWDHLRSLAETP